MPKIIQAVEPAGNCDQPPPLANDLLSRIKTDTLYSWQKFPDVLEWAATGPKTGLFQYNTLYAWRTPAATFAYGDVPIRLKLKPGVVFKEIKIDQRNCSNFPASERESTVYVCNLNAAGWGDRNTLDYILCSPKVLASWSFGTQEALGEVQRELEYAKANPGKSDSYGRYDPKFSDEPFGRMDLPHSAWKAKQLQKKINFLSAVAKTDLPRVFCLGEEEDCLKDHFSTQYPTYFRGRGGDAGRKYADDSFSVTGTKHHVYIDAEIFVKDQSVSDARVLLESKPDLEVIIVAKRPTEKILADVPENLRSDVRAIFSRANVASTDGFKKRIANSRERIFQIAYAGQEGMSAKNVMNFGTLRYDDPDELGGIRGAVLVGALLKMDQAFMIERLDKGFYESQGLDYISRLPLNQAFSQNDYAAYRMSEGKCFKTALGNAHAYSVPVDQKFCELHR